MIELLAGVARIPVSLWASLFVAGVFAWLSLLAAIKAEQHVRARRPQKKDRFGLEAAGIESSALDS